MSRNKSENGYMPEKDHEHDEVIVEAAVVEPTGETSEENALMVYRGSEIALSGEVTDIVTPKRNGEDLLIGMCHFCRQTLIVGVDVVMTEEDKQAAADEVATEKCSCTAGWEYRAKKDRERKRAADMERLARELNGMAAYCEAHGMMLKDTIRDGIVHAAEMILDGEIEKNVLCFSDAALECSITAKVSISAKGKIVLDFKYADGRKTAV